LVVNSVSGKEDTCLEAVRRRGKVLALAPTKVKSIPTSILSYNIIRKESF